MSYGKALSAMKQYQQTAVDAGINDATPFRLIQMLLEGALSKIAVATGHMRRGEIGPKGRAISTAVSIINGLRVSLDKEAGGEIAANLDALYDYMARRLMEAHAKNDPEILAEIAGLLRELKSAWDAIPEPVQRAHAQSKTGATAPTPQAATATATATR